MRARRRARLAAVALCCLALLACAAGCGRKAKPEPLSAHHSSVQHHAQG